MNTSAEVSLKWADGEYLFALKLKQIDELQRLCGALDEPDGIGAIVARVFSGIPRIRDITETIRLGLIGGGMPPIRALEMISTYVDGQPLARAGDTSSPLATAQAVLSAVWFGVSDLKDTDSPKAEAAPKMAGSTSPLSTALA